MDPNAQTLPQFHLYSPRPGSASCPASPPHLLSRGSTRTDRVSDTSTDLTLLSPPPSVTVALAGTSHRRNSLGGRQSPPQQQRLMLQQRRLLRARSQEHRGQEQRRVPTSLSTTLSSPCLATSHADDKTRPQHGSFNLEKQQKQHSPLLYQPHRLDERKQENHLNWRDQQRPSIEHLQYLSLQQYQDMIPRSTDAGHPKTIDTYFEHDHFGQSTFQNTSETPTEDDDDEVARAGRGKDYFFTQYINRDDSRSERRRSRSFSGPLSPFETSSCSPRSIPLSTKTAESVMSKARVESMLITSSDYGVPISPPLSARTSCAPRRRHSCVAPNTKEFHTLAAIFGWVTLPTSNMWSKRWSRQTNDTSLSQRDDPSLYSNDNLLATYESDDEWDQENWDVSCDSSSSCLQSPIQGSLSSDTSLEHLVELNNMTLAALTGHVSPSWKSVLDDSNKTGRSFSSRMRYGIPMDTPLQPDIDPVNHVQRSDPYFSPKFDVLPIPRSPPENHVDNDHMKPEHRKHDQDTLEHGSEENVRKSDSGHSSALYITENDRLVPQSYPESPRASYTERTLMSRPCHPLDEPETTHTTIAQVDEPSCLDNCRSDKPNEAINHPRFSNGGRESSNRASHLRSSKKITHTTGMAQVPCEPPTVPPRYPEIDAQAFDHPEDEGPSTIVYAPLSNSKRDSISGGFGLQPIIAATIVKLIEKLTHHYGMDNGFITDFFITYRMFMSPVQLCKYLIQRYLWALKQDTEERLIVRIRTFVVLRYWINNHFADDFLTSKSLRFQMAFFLNEMRFHPSVQSSSRDGRIIIHLTEFFKQQRRYYKDLAQQSVTMERKRENHSQQKQEEHPTRSHGCTHVNYSPLEKNDLKSVEVERLGVSMVKRHAELQMAKDTTSDVMDTVLHAAPGKGRHRATTLAGAPSRPVASESHCVSTHGKPPLSKEFGGQSMTRQVSEGGSSIARERRLSNSSTKSNRSASNWSTKMTMGISKLRQKSEDIYQQIVHPSNSQHKGDSRICVCWTPAYTGITEHHAINTSRSFSSLRPSVVVTNVPQDTAVPPAATAPTSATSLNGHPKKSIKRLKSSLNLGLSPSTSLSSPVPSPTKSQFSGISRHSRSSSNSSVGYHPNPDCPFHTPCLGSVNNGDSVKSSEEHAVDDNTLTTLKEALQENHEELGSSQQHPKSPISGSIPLSPALQYCPWNTPGQLNNPSVGVAPPYKPFILFYRSQMVAQQLCLLEQHFLEQVRWDELLEMELTKAGRKNRRKNQSMISGYLFKAERVRNGMDASNERSNMLCMWVASEVVSTQPIEDRVRVIEKFIRIAQKCHQYRNFNSLIQLVMGLGSSHLCGLRRTWSRVGSYEMGALQELQAFISPCGNWSIIRKAMNQVRDDGDELDYHQKHNTQGAAECSANASNLSDASASGTHGSSSEHMHKYLHHQVPLEKQGCIPFLGLFVFDLTHIAVSPRWYYPVSTSPSPSMPNESDGANDDSSLESKGQNSGLQTPPKTGTSHIANPTHQLQAPHPKDLQELLPSGTLLVHFYRYQLIAKTIKWFMAFQRRSQKYTFPMDNTLYSKCYLLRVLSNERVGELADTCEND